MIDPLQVPVFVVDDDETIVDMVKKSLKAENFQNINIATSGKEALQLLHLPATEEDRTAQMSSVYVFILDIILPDMNGLDLCSQIKDSFPETIVILISGYDIEDFHKRIIESEADDFLTKPFNPIELVARIRILIQKYNRNIIRNSILAGINNASPHQVPHIGDEIDGYRIIDSLGWGKSSVIYKVIEKNGRDVYAIKLLTRYALDFKEVVKRFEHEVRIMSRISHRNVIKFYKMGDFNGCPYILMDYVYGFNLEEYLVTKGIPNLKVIFAVARQTAAALEAIHSADIIHRDIKLKNIMIELESNHVKITDFGIAKWLEEAPHITRDGFIVGTPIYMAPELFRGDESTFSSDIYSYGVTLYQFITGSPPFVATNNSELYKKHLHEKAKSIQLIRPDVPEELEALIIEKCMGKTPEERPSSISEVLAEVEKIERKYKITEN